MRSVVPRQPLGHRQQHGSAIGFRQQAGGHDRLSGRQTGGHVEATQQAVVIDVQRQAPPRRAGRQQGAKLPQPVVKVGPRAPAQHGSAEAHGIDRQQAQRPSRIAEPG